MLCLSFNLERSNNNIHTCELSSSEKYLEPQKVQERAGYDYYGTEYDVGRPILPNYCCQYYMGLSEKFASVRQQESKKHMEE